MIQFIPKSYLDGPMRVSVQCPHCQENLMDDGALIKDLPSITLMCKVPEEHGGDIDLVRFSSYYGDELFDTHLNVPNGVITKFICPFCEKDLASDHQCDLCNAPMVHMELKKGGMLEYCVEAYERRLQKEPERESFGGKVHFCARRGCLGRRINFENPDADLKEFYNSYSKFLTD